MSVFNVLESLYASALSASPVEILYVSSDLTTDADKARPKKFLDMFSGSGIMGLEALSRGYLVKHIELNPKNAAVIKENYKKTRRSPDIAICNALNYKTDEKFDVIYLDPPWKDDYDPIIQKAISCLASGGIIVAEYDKLSKKLAIPENCKLIKSKTYGRCCLVFLKV